MFRNDLAQVIMKEERRLLQEVSTGRWSWKKLGAMLRLNALLSAHGTYC